MSFIGFPASAIRHLSRHAAVLTAALALAGPVASDATGSPPNGTVPYCQSGELYAPDGMITRIGSRYFRLCSRPAGPHGERTVRVTLNPDTVRGLADAHVLVALRVGDKFGFLEFLRNFKRGLEPAGIRMFGGSAYQAFHGGLLGPNGLPQMATYVPVQLRAAGDGQPDHFIFCVGEDHSPRDPARCNMLVSYFDVLATLGFRRFGGDSPPLPYNRFPEFPAEITRVLERADVTRDMKRWIGRLPFIE